MGFGHWAVEEKASGDFIGDLGFADFKRDIQPSIQGLPELGWVLASRAHGKGYATEAVRAAIAWGAAHRVQADRMFDPPGESRIPPGGGEVRVSGIRANHL